MFDARELKKAPCISICTLCFDCYLRIQLFTPNPSLTPGPNLIFAYVDEVIT